MLWKTLNTNRPPTTLANDALLVYFLSCSEEYHRHLNVSAFGTLHVASTEPVPPQGCKGSVAEALL